VGTDCDFGVDVNDGGYNFSISGDVFVLEVTTQSGCMSKVDVEAFLKHCALSYTDLYIDCIGIERIRDYT